MDLLGSMARNFCARNWAILWGKHGVVVNNVGLELETCHV